MAQGDNYWTGALQRRYSRRGLMQMAAGVGAGYAGLALLGCGGGKVSPGPGGTAASKSPKYGGELHWASAGQLADLDPFNLQGGVLQRGALGVTYDTLVDYDWSGDLTTADGVLIPRLAESWTMPDETTYLFKMRQNVKWHDGTEFTSADVKHCYEYNLDPQNNLTGRSMLSSVSKIEAPDKSTIKITLKKSSAGFLSMLTNDSVIITPKHLLEKDRKGLAMKPVGTGPFMVEKIDPKTGVTYKKNPNYYVKGKPYLDGMVISLIDDLSARAAAFMSKGIDLHVLNDRPQYEAIKVAVPDVWLRSWPGVTVVSCQLNYARPPFNDKRVRRAMLLAIDQKGLMDRLFAGEGTIHPPVMAGSWKKWAIPQDELLKMPGFRQPKTQDLAEAKRLLAEAGFASGLKVTAICDAALTAAKNLQVVADHVRAIGIDVAMECSERAMFSKRANAGDFDFMVQSYSGFTDDPDRRLYAFVHSTGTSNKGKLNDPKLDAMIEKQSQTLNEQERSKIIQDIQRYMIEEAYHPPTPNGLYYGITQSYVRGYDPAYQGVGQLHVRSEAEDIWLDK